MKIKICGLFRDDDIGYVNEARPDYVGFVFAPSKRQVSVAAAERLRLRLAAGIVPVGVFVNAPAGDIAALYREGVIAVAQLHGDEDEAYVARLKDETAKGGGGPVQVIKVIKSEGLASVGSAAAEVDVDAARSVVPPVALASTAADFFLIDSGAGSGKPFDWALIKDRALPKPWFLAGGIGLDNIEQAMALGPYAIDISSGAETDGIKDRGKIVRLTAIARKGIL